MHVGNYVYIIVLKNAMLVNFWCGNLGARGPGGGGGGGAYKSEWGRRGAGSPSSSAYNMLIYMHLRILK